MLEIIPMNTSHDVINSKQMNTATRKSTSVITNQAIVKNAIANTKKQQQQIQRHQASKKSQQQQQQHHHQQQQQQQYKPKKQQQQQKSPKSTSPSLPNYKKSSSSVSLNQSQKKAGDVEATLTSDKVPHAPRSSNSNSNNKKNNKKTSTAVTLPKNQDGNSSKSRKNRQPKERNMNNNNSQAQASSSEPEEDLRSVLFPDLFRSGGPPVPTPRHEPMIFEKSSYAGSSFHNAPAPSALPKPLFKNGNRTSCKLYTPTNSGTPSPPLSNDPSPSNISIEFDLKRMLNVRN